MDGIYTKKKLVYNCTLRGGHGLMMELPIDYQQLITFHTFMKNGDSVLFYSHNLPLRIPQIRKVINNVKNTKLISPTASHLLDEALGGSDQYMSVLHHHDSKLNSYLRVAEDKAMKEAKLSTSRIIHAFTLNNSDPAFIKDQTETDKVMSTIPVIDIYGQFSELTTPILNQVRQLFKSNLSHFNQFSSITI